jgi:hypothetical protein
VKQRSTIRSHMLPHRAGRLAVTMLMLVAFVFQNYVTQTHIHLTPAMAAAIGAPAEHEKYPAKGDPSNCPICQEIAHAGAFVTPSTAPLLLPTFNVSTIALVVEAPIVIHALSHNWQGRAPPHA